MSREVWAGRDIQESSADRWDLMPPSGSGHRGQYKCIRGQKSAQLRNVTRTGQEGAAFDVAENQGRSLHP